MVARPRQERSERTRAHIIEAAAAAFAEHGFDGVSLNDLVAASGLSKGAFYFHFSSKDEIAIAAFRAKQEQILSLLAAQPLPTKAADRLTLVLRKRAELTQEDPSLRCVTRLGSQFNATAPADYASFLDLPVTAFTALVARGQRRGEFRSELDPEAAARTIFACLVGIDSLSHLSSGGKDFETRIDDFVDLLLNGFLTPTGRRAAAAARKATGTAERSNMDQVSEGIKR